MKFIGPLICVSDIKRLRQFYENILNQKVTADFGENITFEGDFAVHLDTHFSKLIKQKIRYGGHDTELYFETEEPDTVAARLNKEKVVLVHPMQEQPWRQKVVRFYDPDGHIIEIGESMPHLFRRLQKEGHDINGISKITGIPEEAIRPQLS